MPAGHSPGQNGFLGAVLVFSAIGIIAGFLRATAADLAPGRSATAPTMWPLTRVLRQEDLPALVMVVHPECPCSRASINELAILMNGRAGKLACYVFIAQAPNADANLLSLRKTLAEIPGITPILDDGHIIAAFHAETSGQVLLYDAQGTLIFNGGITGSRGHEGDNDGLIAIQNFLSSGKLPLAHTPVFGCALH